ncbi:hypothetical protein COO60DRAFT_1120832 [Scenedesmus sp. NREL 46B-D3]|nr:hypothetical protein COO60DRAFT_1120832 [Scenedesmus sp. NREL 46B-D3]
MAAVGPKHASSLTLPIGRLLHVAAKALLQLHEDASGAQKQAEAEPQDDKPLDTTQFEALHFATLLYFCVAALGPLLEAAVSTAAGSSSAAGNSSRTAGAVDNGSAEAGVQGIRELQQLQGQLLQETKKRLAEAARNALVADAAGSNQPEGLGAVPAVLVDVFPASAAQQMLRLATGVCTQLVFVQDAPLCCANPGCTNCSRLSEVALVSGKSTVCSGCRVVRLCSAECNTAYWCAGHRQACKRLRSGRPAKAGGDRKGGSAGGASGTVDGSNASSSGSASISAGSSSDRSSGTGGSHGSVSGISVPGGMGGSSKAGTTGGGAAAAGLDLPVSVAAAAVLGVRQLKALLAGLGVGCGSAVEKSDLVGGLVSHLGLS